MKKIDVVLLEPYRNAKTVKIDACLEEYQKIVRGSIEPVPLEDGVCLVVNENGKVEGLDINRCIFEDGRIVDIIAGRAFICGSKDGDFCTLAKKLRDKYMEIFAYPERIIRVKGGLVVLPYSRKCE